MYRENYASARKSTCFARISVKRLFKKYTKTNVAPTGPLTYCTKRLNDFLGSNWTGRVKYRTFPPILSVWRILFDGVTLCLLCDESGKCMAFLGFRQTPRTDAEKGGDRVACV